MPTFDTPAPVAVTLDIPLGDVRIEAGDRPDTVVEVRPSDPARSGSVAAAEATRVDYTDGRLSVRGPKGRKPWGLRAGDSIDVHIALPAGSTLRAEGGVTHLSAGGRLGEVRVKIGVGEIRLEETGPAELRIGAGDISFGRTGGHTDVSSGSGSVRLGTIDGTAVIKNSNGAIHVGEVTGDLRIKAANGSISVGIARATTAAKTAMGDVRLGEVHRGVVVAETAMGAVEVGVAPGVAAWLDLGTRFGTVRNELDSAERPAPGDQTVEVRADTAMGDITVRRSTPTAAAPAM